MTALRSHFRPEFLNRIDEVVVFDTFTSEELEEIVKLRLVEVVERTRQLGAELLVSDDARRWLAENGYDSVMGARPLRRLIQREIEDKLAELILAGEITPGCSVVVDVDTTEEAAGRGNLRFSILDNLEDGFGVEVGAVGDVN